jgi:NIMA (never in mitosis gene a)-related kinase
MYDTKHLSMQPKSVFLTEEGDFKLADWGVIIDEKEYERYFKEGRMTQIENVSYQSPELLRKEPGTHTSDMWSLGCIIYEMCTLNRAFTDKNSALEKEPAPILGDYSPTFKALVFRLLDKDGTTRPTAEDILA